MMVKMMMTMVAMLIFTVYWLYKRMCRNIEKKKFRHEVKLEGEEKKFISAPSEIFFEILTRLPLESLIAFRKVCKEWEQMTYETNFIRLHCERTPTVNGYFIQYMIRNKYSSFFASTDQSPSISQPSLDFLPEMEGVKIEASSDRGLLCCTHRDGKKIKYFICKPMTKEWVKIPNPKTKFFTHATTMLVKSTSPLHYKIFRFSRPKHRTDHLICEIFDSNNWSWKRAGDIRMEDILMTDTPILIESTFYWLTYNDIIFAFDVDSEEWMTIPLPREESISDGDSHVVHRKLVACEGRLSLCCLREREYSLMDVWILKNQKKNLWESKKRVSLKQVGRENPSAIFKTLYTGEVAFFLSAFKSIWYNFQTRKSMEMEIPMVPLVPKQVFGFQSDTIRCNIDNGRSRSHGKKK